MQEWQNLSQVRWDCKDHAVIVPKYRRRVVYGRFWAVGYLRQRSGPG